MKSQQQYTKAISFEFFPPKTAEGMKNLASTQVELAKTEPKFFSVTFGAGGSTRDRTLETVFEMTKAGFNTAPHISCIGSTKASIAELLDVYQANGINRIVALRGDKPSGMQGIGELNYANELVEYVREKTGDQFHIEVAAYPEFHPEALNAQHDLDCFVEKVRAGANSAITQYFFNADAYFRFIESVENKGVNIPVVPGIMPIGRFTQLARFSDSCGTEIPRWLRKRMEAYGDDLESIEAYGIEVVTELCDKLLAAGAPGLHFYTLNKSKLSLAICENLGLVKS